MAKQQFSSAQMEALLNDFLKKFPWEKLSSLKKEDEPFTWWVESKHEPLDSISGGSAFKFEFYARRSQETKQSDTALFVQR